MGEGYLLASEVIFLVGLFSVEVVGHQGVADMRHVNSDLVSSPGQKTKLAKTAVAVLLDDPVFGYGALSVLTHGAFDIAFLYALDRGVDDTFLFLGNTAY